MDKSPHLVQVTQRLQRRARSLRRWQINLDVLCGGMAVAFLATVILTLAGRSVVLPRVYGALALLILGIYAVVAWRVRVSAMDVLRRADRQLASQECLSTAYEYVQTHPTNPFVPSLSAAAEQLAATVEARRIFPLRFAPRLWTLPIFLAAMVTFALLQVSPLRFDEPTEPATPREVVREGKRLEKWGRDLEELAKQERLDRSLLIARQMQQLGQRLQQEGSDTGQSAARIATLSQYLQRLQQELKERALMSEPGALAAHDVLLSGKNVKQELQEVLQLLQNDALPREMAAAAEQTVMRLSRQVGHNPQLEHLMQNLRAGDLDAARQLLRDVLQQQQTTEEVEHLDRARRALEYSSRSLQRGTPNDPSTGRTRTPADAGNPSASDMADDGMMSQYVPGMEDFTAPESEGGVGTSGATRQQSQVALRESEQPVSNVEAKSGEGSMRLSYMRYLPLHNDPQVPVEKVVVDYQRAAEEVLTREQIPHAYREQIKQYFLSLGMVK